MHVQVIGAGLGAGAALFLPRRRVRVTIFEQDEMAPPQDTDGCFQNWRRRGVAQARQPHAYLFRAMNIYAEEAPDFVAAALKAGGRRAPLDFNGSGSADPDGPELFLSRRLVFEAVLRRIVASEPLVTFRLGARVDGSVRRGGEGGVPHITGVRLDDGEVSLGDLVVDASGHFCAVSPWLAEVGDRRDRHRYRQELVPRRRPRCTRRHRAAAKVVAWPSGSAARQYAALPDRHGSLRRHPSPEPQTGIAWSQCQIDAGQICPPP
jgi:hypothetical protein